MDAPEDPEERRQSLAANFSNLEREDSVDEPLSEKEGRPAVRAEANPNDESNVLTQTNEDAALASTALAVSHLGSFTPATSRTSSKRKHQDSVTKRKRSKVTHEQVQIPVRDPDQQSGDLGEQQSENVFHPMSSRGRKRNAHDRPNVSPTNPENIPPAGMDEQQSESAIHPMFLRGRRRREHDQLDVSPTRPMTTPSAGRGNERSKNRARWQIRTRSQVRASEQGQGYDQVEEPDQALEPYQNQSGTPQPQSSPTPSVDLVGQDESQVLEEAMPVNEAQGVATEDQRPSTQRDIICISDDGDAKETWRKIRVDPIADQPLDRMPPSIAPTGSGHDSMAVQALLSNVRSRPLNVHKDLLAGLDAVWAGSGRETMTFDANPQAHINMDLPAVPFYQISRDQENLTGIESQNPTPQNPANNLDDLLPGRCTKCKHSFDDPVKDKYPNGGPWKKNCKYCRGIAGDRSKPCHCDKCQARPVPTLHAAHTAATLHVPALQNHKQFFDSGCVRSSATTPAVSLPEPPLSTSDPRRGIFAPPPELQPPNQLGQAPVAFMGDFSRKSSVSWKCTSARYSNQQTNAATVHDQVPVLELPRHSSRDLSIDSAQHLVPNAGGSWRAGSGLPAAHYTAELSRTRDESLNSTSSVGSQDPAMNLRSRLHTPRNSIYDGDPTPPPWPSPMPSPITPNNLQQIDDSDWVCEAGQDEKNKCINGIISQWGPGWRSRLYARGVVVQSPPTKSLALSVSRLAQFNKDLSAVLATLPAFNDSPSGKPFFPSGVRTSAGLFKMYDSWQKSRNDKFFSAWLRYLEKSGPSPTN